MHGADSARLTAHGPHLGFQEPNRLPLVRPQEDIVVAGRDFGRDQFIAFVQRHRDDAARHGIIELGQLRFLDHPVPGRHDDELVGNEILDGKEGLGGLVRLQGDQIGNVLSLPYRGGIGDLVGLQPIHPAAGGENQQVAVRGSHNQALHEILGARPHADSALAPARLPPVGVHRGALQVAAARHRDGHVFHRYQVFQQDLAGVFDDLRAPLVAVFLADFLQLVDDQVAKNLVGAQNAQVLRDAPLDFGQLVQDLLPLHPGEPLQLQLDDGLRLLLGELEARNQRFPSFPRRPGRADQPDDFIQVVEGLLEPEQNVLAVARLAQLELRAPPHNLHAVLDKTPDDLEQAQLARLPVHDGQHDDAEAGLELGVLVEIVEDDFGLLAALQGEHDAHAVAVAFVARLVHALEFFLVDEAGHVLDEPGLVHLVGNLGDHNLLVVFAGALDGRLGPQLDLPASPGVCLQDPLPPEDKPAGGKIRPLHELQDLRQRRAGVLDHVDGGVDDLPQIVRRNIGRHAHRDARRPVHQQVGHARGKDLGLLLALVVIGAKIDGPLIDVLQQRGRNTRKARLGVPHGGRRIAIHRAEVPLPFHQRVAHAEWLGHAHQRIVDGRVAMGMVLAHDFTDDFGALARGLVGRQAHFVHSEEDAPIHRLEAVADVRERTAHDDAHGVIEIRPPHLVFDIDGNEVFGAFRAPRWGRWRWPAGRWGAGPGGRPARRTLWW